MATSAHHLGPHQAWVVVVGQTYCREGASTSDRQLGRRRAWQITHDPQSKSVSQQVGLAASLKLFSTKN